MGFIWFCAAGYSFFCGIALLITAILFSVIFRHLWQKLLVYTVTLIGVLLIFLSATILPWWFYIVWIISILVWFVFFAAGKYSKWLFLKSLSSLAICLTITALVIELPFCLSPTMPERKYEKLYIIGDSVGAGIGGKDEQTWPKLLHDKYGINVADLSGAGATVASANRQATQVKSENAMVLLEIGGNDLFAKTPYSVFRENLSQTLEQVNSSNCTVVMLELPLLPWQMEYGRIQRCLAKEFNVIVIPKRFFVSVLSAKEATTDLAHLSPKGHQIMAEKIWLLLGNNFDLTALVKK